MEEKIIAYRACKDSKRQRILHLEILSEAIQLVKKIASSIKLPRGVSYEDLVQVGSIGLIKAIDSFDISKNTKFSTYAVYLIKGEIFHYLRDKSHIIKTPRESKEFVMLSIEEDSSFCEIPAGDYQDILNSHEDKIMISSAIKKLPPDLREVMELSYYEDLNQREISQRINISQMQVSRKLKKALNKMYEIIL